jgi:hypothetical protein
MRRKLSSELCLPVFILKHRGGDVLRPCDKTLDHNSSVQRQAATELTYLMVEASTGAVRVVDSSNSITRADRKV